MSKTIYIVGGSNSLLRGGWVDQLLGSVGSSRRVVNLSIGATTTITGLYRLLSEDPPSGSVVVWEYGLNEVSFCEQHTSPSVLLYHLNWFLSVAKRRRYSVVPLVMYSRTEILRPKRHLYKSMILEAFADNGLPIIDTESLRNKYLSDVCLKDLYEEDAHYKRHSLIVKIIASTVEKVVSISDRGAGAVPSLDRFTSRQLEFIRPGSSGESVVFRNRVMEVEGKELDREINFGTSGHLIALIVICSARQICGQIAAEGQVRGPFSFQINPLNGTPTRQLKHILAWTPRQPKMKVRDWFSLIPLSDVLNKPTVQYTHSWVNRDFQPNLAYPLVLGAFVETETKVEM